MANVVAMGDRPAANAGPLFDPKSKDRDLRDFLDRYERSIDLTHDARLRSQRSVEYYENKQWTAREIATLKARKQPIVTENHIQPKVNFMVGLEITTRTDPKAFPRTPEDEEGAEAATDAVRSVVERNNFPGIASDCWGDLLKAGYCGVELGVVRGPEGPEIEIQHYQWDRLFADPHSRKHDYSDANYLGGVKWMDLADARAQWRDADAQLQAAMNYGDLSDTHGDRPRFAVGYASRALERVMIVYMWYRKPGGRWCWVKFTRGGVLEGGEGPYVTDEGKPLCPLLMQAAYVTMDNERHGEVEYMKSTQDEINHRKSRALYQLSRRGVIKSQDAVEMSDEDLRKEVAKPDYVVTKTHHEAHFELDTGQDLSQGQMHLLAENQTHMDRLGPNATMVGKDDKDQSGRARLAQSQAGFVEQQPTLERHRQFKRRVYETAWYMIKQFWTEERWVRVTDDEDKARFVGLNQPVQAGEYTAWKMQERGASEEEILRTLQEMTLTGEFWRVVRKNDVSQMGMDFMIEEVPDHATVQTEAFEQLMTHLPNIVKLMEVSPALAKAVIEASPLRNKKRLIEALDGGPDDPQAQQAQAVQEELQMRAAAAQVENAENQAQKTGAEALKAVIEAENAPVASQANLLKAQAAYEQAIRPPF